MKKISLAVLMPLFMTAVSFGSFSSSDKGTTSANFLKLGVGGRAESLGEAFSAVSDDAVSLYWNPAGLARQPEHAGSAVFMHAPYVESGYYDYVALSHNTGRYGAWGIGAQYFTTGSIPQTDRLANDLGTFTPYDVAGSIGYANNIGGFSLGIAAKYIQSKILASAQTFATDFGVMTPDLANDHLRFAFVAQNVGGKLQYDEAKENLPLTLRAGSAYTITDRWLLSLDGVFPRDNSPYAAIGSEYRWPIGDKSSLAGRVGFNSRSFGDVDGVSNVSMGVGLNLHRISVDYAFIPMGQLGLTHRISLGVRWGNDEGASQQSVRVRSPRQASRDLTCEELYGAENCKGNRGTIFPRSEPAYPETDRPW